MSEATVSDIDVNGVTLRVHEAGDSANPTVVLCHGFPELAYSWRHQMAPVADAGFHVIAPDQRGYGHSSAPRQIEAYGITQLTDDLLGLLDHFGKDDAVFVGHDWGALIVWDLARLHPERVRAVVGVSVPFTQWPAPPTQLMKMVYGVVTSARPTLQPLPKPLLAPVNINRAHVDSCCNSAAVSSLLSLSTKMYSSTCSSRQRLAAASIAGRVAAD